MSEDKRIPKLLEQLGYRENEFIPALRHALKMQAALKILLIWSRADGLPNHYATAISTAIDRALERK